jgi:hypothetical protein
MKKGLLLLALSAAQPALDDALKEEFLRTAPEVEARPAGKGITDSWRVTLRDGALTHDAHFQSVDVRATRKEVAGHVELLFRDSYRYNIAAYRLARLLGLQDMVPVSVERRWRSETGAMTWWVDDVMMDESERIAKGLLPPGDVDWRAQSDKVKLFSQLVHDTDRNQSNVLITKSWRLWMIDFTRAFRPWPRLRSPEELPRCDRDLYERLRKMTKEDLETAMGPILEPPELQGILARRDLLVAHFEKLISERGEDAVLSGPQPTPANPDLQWRPTGDLR